MSDIFTIDCVHSALCWTNSVNGVEFVNVQKQIVYVRWIFCTGFNNHLNKTNCAAYCTNDVSF